MPNTDKMCFEVFLQKIIFLKRHYIFKKDATKNHEYYYKHRATTLRLMYA